MGDVAAVAAAIQTAIEAWLELYKNMSPDIRTKVADAEGQTFLDIIGGLKEMCDGLKPKPSQPTNVPVKK